MAREDATPSPASQKLASKLSKYSYNPTTPIPSPLRSTSTPLKTQSRPSPIPTSTGCRRSTVKRERLDSEDEDAEDDEYDDIPSPSKKAKTPAKKRARPFAGPEVYAHLQPVTDHLKPDLDILFCGINPGKKSATAGHHFAHPTNKFWRALHLSGLTPRLYSPAEDHTLPGLLNYGLTNLCGRPTSEQSELSTLEMKLNVPELTGKVIPLRPRVVCFVGKKIWDIYEGVCEKTAGEAVFVDEDGGGCKSEGGGEVEGQGQGEGEGRSGGTEIVVKEEELVDEELGTKVKVERGETPITGAEEGAKVKVERGGTLLAGAEDDVKVVIGSAKKTPKKVVIPINWHKPRSLRLQFGDGMGYTYFWVTPNTSGLERTPLAEQIEIFKLLRLFVEDLKIGKVKGSFRDIDAQGVITTAEDIRVKAMARAKST